MRLKQLLLCLFSFLPVVASAQVYPVQVTVQAISPYPIYLSDFTQGMSDRLRVQLLLTDVHVQSRRVRLKMSLAGGGLNLTNPDVVNGALPIELNGGMPEYMGNDRLAPYFNPQNLPGMDPVAYTQPLPEGVYTLCFEAFDFITGEVLSRKSCYTMALIQNDPPLLSLPRNNEGVPQQNPQSLLFQWTPRHLNATNVSYEFSLLELVDTFISPQAAMQVMQPYYQTTTYSTSLWLGPADVPLVPGRKYAWRVRAKSLSGLDELGVFKNNGYSEAWAFTYTDANCAAPMGLLATDIAKRSMKVQWMPLTPGNIGDDITYRISYRLRNNGDRWYDRQTTATELSLFDLDPGTEYELRLGRMCAGMGFVYGNNIYATTASATDSTVTTSCGLPPAEVDISNQAPLVAMHAGENFTAGDFKVTALQVSGAGGTYSGDGYITVPYLANAKIKVKFNNIFINSERKLAQGFVETTYDPTMSGILDLDDIFEGGSGTGTTVTGEVVTDYQTNFPIGGPGNIVVTGPDDHPSITIHNVTNGGGSGLTISPDSLPVSIADSNGDIYTVEPGNGGAPVITKAGEQVPMQMTPAQLNNLASNKGKVLFARNNNTQYAFDAYKPEYGASVLWQGKYESLGNEYRVAAKATLPGKPDRITAQVTITDNNLVADSVQFVTAKGTRYTSKHLSGNEYEVMMVGSPANDAQELYAVYPLPVNSPADSGKYLSLGKLLVAGYGPKTAKVVVVPVNGGVADTAAIAAKLNATYNVIGIKWEVQQAAPWNDSTWDADHNGKLSVTGSSAWSVYTPEMEALNTAYKTSHTLVSGAVYLFALPQAAEAGVAGDMPRGKRYGYLFTNNLSDAGRVAAHEIGHGMFALKHTFDNAYGFAQGALSDNIMSYGSGIALSKLQWDAVHAPGLVIGVFEGDEDAMGFDNAPKGETGVTYLLDRAMNFVAMSGKIVPLPQGALVKFYCVDYNSCNTNGQLIGFKINNVEYLAKTSEIRYPMNTFTGFYKIAGEDYTSEVYKNASVLTPGNIHVSFLHEETLTNGKHLIKVITEEKAVASAQLEALNGAYAGSRNNYDFIYNSTSAVASADSLLYSSTCGSIIGSGTQAGSNGGQNGGSIDNGNYTGKKYLDELAKKAGKGNDPSVTLAPGAPGGNLYDYANTLSATEKQKIINDLGFIQSNTGVEGRIYITDHLTPQATKDAIGQYLEHMDGKVIGIWVDIDAAKKTTSTIKVGSGVEGGDASAVSTYTGKLKENTWYSVLNVWGCEFNPLTAVLDGLAGLIGKLEVPDRFYNPDAPKYNPLPAKIYGLVTGKVLTDAVAKAVFGTNPAYPEKYNKVRCDFAMTCGVWNGAVQLVAGIPAGASFIIKIIVNEDNTRDSLAAKMGRLKWDDVKKMASDGWNKYTANPCMISYSGGHVVFFVASCFIGVGEIGAASDALNVLSKIDVMGQMMTQVIKIGGKLVSPVVKVVANGVNRIVFKPLLRLEPAASLALRQRLANSVTSWLRRPAQQVYLSLHATENGTFLVNGVEKNGDELGEWLATKTNLQNKEVVLLSCNDLESAAGLAQYTNAVVYTTDGAITVFENGIRRAEGTHWYKVEPNGTRTLVNDPPVNECVNCTGEGVKMGASGAGSLFADIKLGQLIGEGGNKNVYEIIGRSESVVAVLKKGKPASSIDDEIALLGILSNENLPVVEILEKGVFDGQAAIIMKKYAQGSKDVVKRVGDKIEIVGNSSFLNQKSILDLTRIKNLMSSKKIKIDDLQFLIANDGSIVIADPLAVFTKQAPSKWNNQTIDKLIEVANKNIK